MTAPEWNSFDDLKAETLELHTRIDAMAFRLVGVTDQRNRYMARLELALDALRHSAYRNHHPNIACAGCELVNQALRETEGET